MDAHASDTVLRLVAGYHANLLARDLSETALPEASLPTDPATLAVWQAALTAPLHERQSLAYLLTLSLPTPHLSQLQERIHPLLHFDVVGRLPVDIARAVLGQLDLRSVIACSSVSRSWRRLAYSDQLLWRDFYERAGWRYDERAVAYWNALGSSWVPTADDAMAVDERAPSRVFLSPGEAGPSADYFARTPSPGQVTPSVDYFPRTPSPDFASRSRRVSNTLGLPPSPRHVDHPAAAPRSASAGEETWRQRLRANRERSARPSSPDASGSLTVDSLEHASSRHDPFELRLPQRSNLDMRVTPPRRLDLSRTSPLPIPMARDLVPPRSLVLNNVSAVHRDEDGRPAVNWRYMVRARHEARRNWRRGRFTTHDIRPPAETGEHGVGVYAVQFDGRHIVTGNKDAVARMYDIDSGELVRIFVGHVKSVLCLQFDDERVADDAAPLRLVTGSSDCTAILWELDSGRAIRSFVGHTDSITGLRFAGDVLVTCSKDHKAAVWSMSTGELVHRLDGHAGAVNAIGLHNQMVVTASGDRTIRVWDLESGTCTRILEGHQRGIATLFLDGQRMVSGSSDATIRIYDTVRRESRGFALTMQSSGECRLAIPAAREPRSREYVEAHEAPSVLYAVDAGQAVPNVSGHSDLVRTLQCDGELVVSGSYDERVTVYSAHTGAIILDLHAHAGRVLCLAFDATRLVSCSQTMGEQTRVFDFGHDLDRSFLC